MTEGTARTLKWVAGGMRSGKEDASSPEPAAAAPVAEAASDQTWGERLSERFGHSQRTIGIAIGLGVIAVLWLGWTAYVWAENGMTAGLGVLITWPAVLAAVTLVCAPFVGGAVAVRRHRAGEPVLMGAGAGAIAPAEPAAEAVDETDDEAADEPEPDDEPDEAEAEDDESEDDEPDEDESGGEDEEAA